MRRFIIIFLFIPMISFGQNNINYQAIVSNSSGSVISSQSIGVKLSVIYTNANSGAVYSETHTTTTTSSGLINIKLGSGGTASGTFANVDWSTSAIYLKSEVNIGSGYVNMGTQQIEAVPVALYAKNVNLLDANNTIAIGGVVSATNSVAIGKSALSNNTSGGWNTAVGMYSLLNNTTGSNNVANGYGALFTNTSSSNNTANGYAASYNNTTGSNNTANGNMALFSNTTGANNTAIGKDALKANTSGDNNIAIGGEALYSNTTGERNTANGYKTLYSNTTASYNTANGYRALYSNTTGDNTIAIGFEALYSNTTGVGNAANGFKALYSNTTGSNNTANGKDALFSNTTGYTNTANGVDALRGNTTGAGNVANGLEALDSNTTGNNNTAIGNGADVASNNLSNVTAIGYGATVSVSNTIQLGNSNVTLVQTSGTISATAFVGDGSGLTGVSGASYTNEILIHPHEVTTNASVSYPPGYSINLIPFPEGTSTLQGGVLIPLMMPSNWNKGNVSITFYWSCSAADGDIYFNTGARKYGTGDLNITYPVAGFDLTPSAAWTLYKHTFTQTVGDYNSNSSDDNLLIINFSRYGYQPSTYGDTNTGNMYIHGIKIGYSTN